MLLAERKQAAAVDEVEWLATSELVAVRAEAGRGDYDSLGCALVLHSPPQVTYVGWLNSAGIQLGLNDELPAGDGVRVVGDAVDASVAGGPGQLGVEAHLGEQVLDEFLELIGTELEQVRQRRRVVDHGSTRMIREDAPFVPVLTPREVSRLAAGSHQFCRDHVLVIGVGEDWQHTFSNYGDPLPNLAVVGA